MNKAGFFETLLGVVVVGVAALFLYYAYGLSGRDIMRGGYQLNAIFGRVDGISLGAEVRIAGVKIGAVTANALDPETYEARIAMAIAAGVDVPDDSVAKIVSDGILGGAHVSIEPGASEEFLRAGDTIAITQGSVDLLGLAVGAFTNNAAASPTADGNEGPSGELQDD